MNYYNHSNENAVGICRGCSKALCHDCKDKNASVMVCAHDQSCHEYLAYTNGVRSQVESQAKYLGNNTLSQAAGLMKATPYVYLILSMTFCGLGFYEHQLNPNFYSVTVMYTVFGVMFAGLSALQFWKRRN